VLTTSTPSVSRFSRKCFSLDVSQPRGLSQHVTGTVLAFYMLSCRGSPRDSGTSRLVGSQMPLMAASRSGRRLRHEETETKIALVGSGREKEREWGSCKESERERRWRVWRVSDCILRAGWTEGLCTFMQCPLVHLMRTRRRRGKALRSEESKFLGCEALLTNGGIKMSMLGN
jgi:hypothetical protein